MLGTRTALLTRASPHFADHLIDRILGALGGDAAVPGLWDISRGLRMVGSAVGAFDDLRCTRPGGRYYLPGVSGEHINCGAYTGLDGVSKAGFFVVVSPTAFATNAVMVGHFDGANGYLARFTTSSTIQVYTDPSNHTDFTFAAIGGISAGDVIAIAITFDGTKTAGTRISAWAAKYAPTTDTWGAMTALATTGAVTDAVALSTSTDNLRIGAYIGGTSGTTQGFIDDVRIFEGKALTQAQFQAELDAFKVGLTAGSPNGAALWYPMERDVQNYGTRVGNNGTATSSMVLCSDQIQYGPSLTSAGTNRPSIDAATGLVKFNGVNQYLRGFRGRLTDMTGSCAVSLVGKCPPNGASDQRIVTLSASTLGELAVYIRQTDGLLHLTPTPETGGVAYGSGSVIPVHGRHTIAGANVTGGVQVGAGAETTQTSAFAMSTITRLTLAAAETDSPSVFGAPSFMNVILFNGDYSGKQTPMNLIMEALRGAIL